MLNCVIIDDEIYGRQNIRTMLHEYFPGIHVAGEEDNVTAAVELIRTVKPDLVFLDVKLKSETAFDLLELFRGQRLNVILITAYKDYALHAIKHGVLDYILKPIDPDEFRSAVNRALLQIGDTGDRALNLAGRSKSGSAGIVVKFRDGFQHVEYKNILFLEASSNYTKFHLSGSVVIMSSRTLKEYQNELDGTIFLRVHRSYLINLMHAKNALFKNNTLIMENKVQIPLSKKRQAELKRKILAFIQ